MKRALDIALKGKSMVLPNPMVRAVLVKNGKIISEGFHRYFGGPHAEVNALKGISKRQISGAKLYVTLEPCCFYGKTPPCANFLLSKGISDLYVAMRDPNPLVSGKGIAQLREAGVNVHVGLLEAEARRLNEVFVKNITQELPFLSIKLGTTLDGKIATLDGTSKYITNELSRRHVHSLRAHVNAIITSSETVLKDDPHLGVRAVKGKDPLRIIIDSRLRTSPSALVYRDNNVCVATTDRSPLSSRKIFARHGVELLVYKGNRVPLKRLLADLYRRGVCHALLEAGSRLTTAFLRGALADSLFLFLAPKILGRGIPWVQDLGIRDLKDSLTLENIQFCEFGGDIMIKGTIQY